VKILPTKGGKGALSIETVSMGKPHEVDTGLDFLESRTYDALCEPSSLEYENIGFCQSKRFRRILSQRVLENLLVVLSDKIDVFWVNSTLIMDSGSDLELALSKLRVYISANPTVCTLVTHRLLKQYFKNLFYQMDADDYYLWMDLFSKAGPFVQYCDCGRSCPFLCAPEVEIRRCEFVLFGMPRIIYFTDDAKFKQMVMKSFQVSSNHFSLEEVLNTWSASGVHVEDGKRVLTLIHPSAGQRLQTLRITKTDNADRDKFALLGLTVMMHVNLMPNLLCSFEGESLNHLWNTDFPYQILDFVLRDKYSWTEKEMELVVTQVQCFECAGKTYPKNLHGVEAMARDNLFVRALDFSEVPSLQDMCVAVLANTTLFTKKTYREECVGSF